MSDIVVDDVKNDSEENEGKVDNHVDGNVSDEDQKDEEI